MKIKIPLLLTTMLWLAVPRPAPAATLEEIAADRRQWPAEVTVTATTKATVINNGQPGGMMLVGAGGRLVVADIAPGGVTGKLGGATIRVPADKTDLLQRVNGGGPTPVAEAAAPSPQPPVREVTAGGSGALPAMQRRLTGKLVRLAGTTLQPVDASALTGVKYYGLYYSASWCGPCRRFTPGLVAAYRQLKEKYPEFELVFISADNSAGDMRDYMREDRMPWPALRYELREHNPELIRYAGPGIPCLVLVDAAGRVLADSYEGDNYIGPRRVLDETRRILEKNHRG